MNELETYVASLQDQGLSVDEIKAKVMEWKKINQPVTEEVVETEVLEEVDLGTVKTKDGAVGASAPSVGPQPAPEPTELTLEDGFVASPEPSLKTEEIKLSDYETMPLDKKRKVPYSQRQKFIRERSKKKREEAKTWEEKFSADVVSADIKDLSNEQYIDLTEKAQKELVKEKDPTKDYTISDAEIKTRASKIFEENILPISYTDEPTIVEKTFGVNPFTDFLGDIIRAGEQGLSQSDIVDPTFDLMNSSGDVSDEEIKNYIEANRSVAEKAKTSDEMRDFNKVYKENGGGVLGFIKGVVESPTIVPAIFVSSMASQLGAVTKSEEVALAAAAGAGTGAAVGSIVPGIGTATGAMSGMFAGAATTMESAMTFSELLQEEVGEDLSVENIRNVLEDEERISSLINRSVARGVTIGAIEGLTGGLAKGVGAKLAKKALPKVGVGAAVTSVESVGGGIGEVAGRIAADQEMDVAEIGFEAIAGTTTAPISTALALANVNQRITDINMNKELKTSNVNNVIEAFSPETPTSEAEVKISQIPGSLNAIDAKADKQVKTGEITIEQANDVKLRAREVQGSVNRLKPLGISVENQPAIVDLMIEQKKLKNTIKQVDNSSLTKAESDRLTEIDAELGNLILKDKTIGVDAKAIKKGAGAAISQLGAGVERIDNTEDFISSVSSLEAQGVVADIKRNEQGEILPVEEQDYGIFAKIDDGKGGFDVQLIINDASAEADGVLPADKHELLHLAAMKMDDATKVKIGKDLKSSLLNDSNIEISPRVEKLLEAYELDLKEGKITEAGFYEEVMAVASDGLTPNSKTGIAEIKVKDIGKFKAFVQKILQAIGWRQNFANGQQAINFLKDFNADVLKGEGLSESVLSKFDTKTDTEVDMGLETEVDLGDVKASKRVYQEVEAMKPDLLDSNKKKDATIMAAYSLVDEAKRRMRNINLSEDVIDDIARTFALDEKRGLVGLIDKWTPDRNDSVMGYLNAKSASGRSLFDARLQEFYEADPRYNEIIQSESQEGVTEKMQRQTATEQDVEVPTKPVTRKIKASSFISDEAVTKIKEQVQEKIKGIDPKNLTFKKLGDLAPEIIAAEIGIEKVKKLTSPTANLSKGDATAIQQFVNKNADKLLKILPEGAVVEAATEKLLGTSTGVPKSLLNAFYTKQARLGKGAGLAPFKLNKGISKADFLEAFGIVEGKKAEGFDARSPQAQALKGIASLYGKLVTNEIVRSDTDLSLEAKQDVAAGKNKAMASKKVNIFLEKQEFEKVSDELAAENKQWKFIAKTIGVDFISAKNPEDVKKMQDWVLNVLAPRVPKSFFTNGTFANAGTSAAKRNFFFTSGLVKRDGSIGELGVLLENAIFAKENENISQAVSRKTYVTGGRYGKVSEAFIKKFNTKKFKQEQQQKLDGLKDVFKVFETLMKEDKSNASFIVALLGSTSQGMGHFVRTSAPIKFYAKDVSSGIVEEHTMPASLVAKYLFNSAFAGTLNKDFKGIEKNYFQGALPYADDKKLKGIKLNGKPFNYTEMTPEGWKMSDNIWARYFNINVGLTGGGIDPSNIVLADGRTVYETYNITSTGVKVDAKAKASRREANNLDNNLLPDAITYDKPVTTQTLINALEKTDKALELARKLDQPVKKIRVFDFDDTLARTKSNVLYTMPDGTTGAIDAATFAKEAGNMEAEGAQWDFSEFSKVMQGSKGPLLDVAKIIADKRGTKDVFVLTARPADAAGPIKEFLASMGLDIPLANITGLGDGTPQAKAGWIMGKAAEGYNDFYFADDHTGNVKAVKDVLSQIDVKSKVQLAKASKRQTFDTVVNDMIEDSSGIETYKKYSAARAKTVGASKGKYNFLIPPSAEDFTGLLYKMLGKGRKGDAQMAFLKTNLLDTYNRAESAVTQAKISAANDFVALKTQLKTLPKTLSKQTGIGKFTYSHAVRVAAWTKQGMDIPGLSKRDVKELNDFVKNDSKLNEFTNELIVIQKGKEYPKPGKDWLGGNITTDIISGINKVNRAEYQQEWRENIDIIFSEDNMNKMEAAYGSRWREAMEDSIRRMKAGTNRPIGGNRVTEGLLDWLNNSVGAVMFLNTRSALLQTISSVNFVNWSDNNIVSAGKAFANQPQFWKDFMTLMNSDYLVERRNGLKINVSESEIADAVKDSKNKPKAAIAFLLSKGFVMTRFADSFAIASGGSTFYRNRIKSLMKQGLSEADATKQAFADFKAIAEESQQSSSPSKISQQQASAAGRVILAWANTPMQYARIQKRAAQDLINGRGDAKSHISKIVYYGAIQNLIFNTLQQAVFALGFGDDDETDEDKATKRKDKAIAVANGMIDSQLKGLGIFGSATVALKNALTTLAEQYNKKGPKYEKAVADLLNFSPPLGSKISKIRGGLRSFSWNMGEMKKKGFSLDNPAYLAGAQVVTGFTNIPLDRVAKKINNIRGIVNERSALWQKVALGLGWSTWDVGLGYYGGFDKEKPLTPKQQLKLEVDTMKKETSKSDQVKTLLDFGLTKKQIRELKNENNRVKKILELQKKDKNEK
eukprot:COSAG06_NODE_791_length_12277_cov_3.863607_2_plen_2523_part_00